MRVLVTGGAGFLGSHLVDSLVELGDEVVVLDDLSRGHRSQIDSSARFVQGDVRSSEDWEKACQNFKPEVIHHLAAINGTRRFHKEADLVVDVNVNGTRLALEFAKRHSARLVFYSSPRLLENKKICHYQMILTAALHLHICTSATLMALRNT